MDWMMRKFGQRGGFRWFLRVVRFAPSISQQDAAALIMQFSVVAGCCVVELTAERASLYLGVFERGQKCDAWERKLSLWPKL